MNIVNLFCNLIAGRWQRDRYQLFIGAGSHSRCVDQNRGKERTLAWPIYGQGLLLQPSWQRRRNR